MPDRRCRRRHNAGANAAAAALLVAALLATAACASNPIPADQNDMMVRYVARPAAAGNSRANAQGAAASTELLLIKETHSAYEELAAANQERASVKRVPADMFQALIDRLDDAGFFEMARANSAVPAESRFAIAVETPQQSWVLAKNPSFTLEDHERFREMFEAIRACHDSIWTFRVIENEKGNDFFLEERDRLQGRPPEER